MKFGINLSSALPRPWRDGDEERLVADSLRTGVLADQLGFDYVWVGEHHFLEEYHHLSASEVFVGALAASTGRIRLAHGIMTLQPQMNHPVRAAERIALEDLLSHGRVDFGSGRGSGEKEWAGFGIRAEDTKAAWKESLRAIVAMWKTEAFSWQGRHFSMPERNIVPKPAQKPHPPLWLACTNPETQRLAGQLGLGSIAFMYAGLEDVAERVRIYRDGLRHPNNPISEQVNDCFAFFTNCVVDADEAHAKNAYLASSQRQREVFTTAGWASATAGTLGAGVKREIAAKGAGVDWEDILARRGSVVGCAERAVETLRAYAAIGIDVTVFNTFPGISGMAEVERNLRYLAEHVIPLYRRLEATGPAPPSPRARTVGLDAEPGDIGGEPPAQ